MVATQIFFMFTPKLGTFSGSMLISTGWWFQIFIMFALLGGMIQFDEHIFQLG